MNEDNDIIDRKDLDRPLFRGLSNESDEELFFLWWAYELLDAGFISLIERAESILLSNKISRTYIIHKELKTKVKEIIKNQVILHEHIYTPEYKIVWNTGRSDISKFIIGIGAQRNGKHKLITRAGVSMIECKPSFDHRGKTQQFIINQKWCYDKLGIFINLVIPETLFANTFCPKQYIFTPTGRQKTSIKFPVRTLEEFLNQPL